MEELLLLLVVEPPNRLGAGVEDEDVVELVELAGLVELNENAGFGAVESAAFCPKVKVGFGASEVTVSLLSAGFPNVKAGGGCSVGALGLLNEKPPVVAAAGSASLLAAPKRKLDGSEEPPTSFLSSGFPKVNVGAAGSLFACNDPNAGLPCDATVAELGSPNLPNTDPVVVDVVVVVAALPFVDVALSEDASPSLFS